MNSGEFHLLELVKDYVVGLGIFILSLFGWQMRRNQSRIDDLEKSAVPRTEFNDTVQSLRTRITDSERTLTDRINAGNRGTHERLDRMLEIIANKD